jgi:branched-chain amino acid transport system substrate-binding protein
MQDQNITDVYAMAPNYAAGKDMVQGSSATKNKIVGEVYTQLGSRTIRPRSASSAPPTPRRCSCSIPVAWASSSEAVAQAAARPDPASIPCTRSTEISLPAVKEAALSQFETRYWSPDLKNDANQKYAADYRKKFGKTPCVLRRQSYDGIMLIDAAIRP